MSNEVTGVELDEYFDLVIDPTGDVGKVSGLDEVAKNISGRVREIIEAESIGTRLGRNRQLKLESRIESAILENEWTVEAEARVRGNPAESTIIADIIVLTSLGVIEDVIRV